MTSLDIIKSKIQKLYKTNPNIHINVATTHPKVNLKNEPVVLRAFILTYSKSKKRVVARPKPTLSNTLMYYYIILRL